MDIRPLTHTSKTGALYYRDASVEQQILSLADLPGDEVLTRAHDQAKDSPGYIQEEALVYWIREYLYRGDSRRASELAGILLQRCAKWIQSKLRNLEKDAASQAEQDVVGDLFKDIADLDSDRADFLQLRFWLALDRRITNAFHRYIRDARRTAPLSAPEEGEKFGDDDQVTKGGDSQDSRTVGLTAEERVLMQDALAAIDDPYRTAFILRHYHDWPIESKDADVLTISSYYKKEPRTIRNWLKRAEQALRAWENEERS